MVGLLVRTEAQAAREGRPARIMAKMNSLLDPKIIEDLYLASQAGGKIDLIVRSACALRAGVPGLSRTQYPCAQPARAVSGTRAGLLFSRRWRA